MATIAPAKTDTMSLRHGEYEGTVNAVEDAGMSDPARFAKPGEPLKEPVRRWLFKIHIDSCVDCFDDKDPTVCDGKVGQEHFQWCNESSAPKSTMYKIVKACGLNPDEFDTDDCVGKRIKFTYDEDSIGGKAVSVITTARPLRGKRVAQATDDDQQPPF